MRCASPASLACIRDWPTDDPLADLDGPVPLLLLQRCDVGRQSASLDTTERDSQNEHLPLFELRHQLRDVQHTIREPERDLRLAARVGSALLDQTQQGSPPRRGSLRHSIPTRAGLPRPHRSSHSPGSTSDVHRDDYFGMPRERVPAARAPALAVDQSTSDLSTISDYHFPSVREDGLVHLASQPTSSILSEWDEVQHAHAREFEAHHRLMALGEENDALNLRLERLVQETEEHRSRDRRKAETLEHALELMQDELCVVLRRNAELEQSAPPSSTSASSSPLPPHPPSPQMLFPTLQGCVLAIPNAADCFGLISRKNSLTCGSVGSTSPLSEDCAALRAPSADQQRRLSRSSISASSRLSEDLQEAAMSGLISELKARISVLEQANRALCSGMLKQAGEVMPYHSVPVHMEVQFQEAQVQESAPPQPGYTCSGVTASSTQTHFVPQLPSQGRVGPGDQEDLAWETGWEEDGFVAGADDELPGVLAALEEDSKDPTGFSLPGQPSQDYAAVPPSDARMNESPALSAVPTEHSLTLRLRAASQLRGRGPVRWADDQDYGRTPLREETQRLGLSPARSDGDGGPSARLQRGLWPPLAVLGAVAFL